jgi:hypothetical protein
MHIPAGAGVDVGGAHTRPLPSARAGNLHQKKNGFFQAFDYLWRLAHHCCTANPTLMADFRAMPPGV